MFDSIKGWFKSEPQPQPQQQPQTQQRNQFKPQPQQNIYQQSRHQPQQQYQNNQNYQQNQPYSRSQQPQQLPQPQFSPNNVNNGINHNLPNHNNQLNSNNSNNLNNHNSTNSNNQLNPNNFNNYNPTNPNNATNPTNPTNHTNPTNPTNPTNHIIPNNNNFNSNNNINNQLNPNNPSNHLVSQTTQTITYQNLNYIIKNQGFKSITGSSDTQYQIIQGEYAAEEIGEICDNYIKKYPTTKKIMERLKIQINDRPKYYKNIGIKLDNKCIKALRILWQRKDNQYLIGTQTYDFNYILNPNTAIITQTNLQKSHQQYIHTTEQGHEYPHNAQQNYMSSHQKIVDVSREMDEEDFVALKKMCKIGDGQLENYRRMLHQGKFE